MTRSLWPGEWFRVRSCSGSRDSGWLLTSRQSDEIVNITALACGGAGKMDSTVPTDESSNVSTVGSV